MNERQVNSPPASAESQAARAALLFLRAAASIGGHAMVRAGAEEPTSSEEAAEHLSETSKPIRCTAAVADGVLVVAHQPLAQSDATDRTAVHGWLRGALSATTEDGASKVLLRGHQEEWVVSRNTLLLLEPDYDLEVPCSSSDDHPSPEQSRHGIGWVGAIGPPAIATTDVNDLHLPDDLCAVIKVSSATPWRSTRPGAVGRRTREDDVRSQRGDSHRCA